MYGGILGLHLTFLNIFSRSVGLSTSQAGFISDTCVSQRNTTNNTSLTITYIECEEERHDKLKTLFYVLLAIVVFGSMFVISMPGYVDTIVINIAKTDGNNASYGAQRIFGSLGFSMFTFLGGWAADKYNYPGMSHYTAVFYIYIPLCLLLIPVGCYLV